MELRFLLNSPPKIFKKWLRSLPNQGNVFYISGENQNLLASTAIFLISQNCKVVLLPKKLRRSFKEAVVFNRDTNGVAIYLRQIAEVADFQVGMFTSGSTGRSKLFGFSLEQIDTTIDWYKQVYKLTSQSLVLTSLPTTYNFSFIAGVYQMACVGGKYLYLPPERIVSFIKSNINKFDKIVILANPLILDILSEFMEDINDQDLRKILIDSGGAPLSTYAIQWFRKFGLDLREGYGLTETCSLTHFDQEGSVSSMGSVGHGMPGVHTRLIRVQGKDVIQITSPNIGILMDFDCHYLSNKTNKYLTTDIGKLDSVKRLIILGRSSDCQINGFWPKDTLEIVSEITKQKCVLVQHAKKDKIYLNFWDKDFLNKKNEIKKLLSDTLDIPSINISLYSGGGQLLHSLKLKRKGKYE